MWTASINMAARVSVPESILYPREYNAVNVGGTVAVMEAIRDAGVKRVVLASWGAVYGARNPSARAQKLPPNTNSPYAVSKLLSGTLRADHRRIVEDQNGVFAHLQRLWSGTKHYCRPAHAPVIPQFLKQALTNGSLVTFGEGRQTRDFVYVDQRGRCAGGGRDGAQHRSGSHQHGGGTEITIDQLIDLIGRLTHQWIAPLRNNSGGGAKRLWANIGKAQALLGYTPHIALEDGLRLTIERDPRFRDLSARLKRATTV